MYLFCHSSDPLSELAWIHFGRYLHQRMAGRPTQYITKKQEFYGRDFAVTPDVLIPRPETEHLVAAALDRVRPRDRVVDVGCGSGALAVTIALESTARVCAIDISIQALRVSAANARRLGASVDFVAGDLLACIAPGSTDIVVSNPPYIALHEAKSLQREVRDFEPHLALFGGEDGNEIYRRLAVEARKALRPGGWLLLELGWKSADSVRSLLRDAWSDIETLEDLAAIPRVLVARWTP